MLLFDENQEGLSPVTFYTIVIGVVVMCVTLVASFS